MNALDRLRALHAAAPSPMDISDFRSDGITYRGLSRDPSGEGTSTLVARFYEPCSQAYQRKLHAIHNALPALLACVDALRESADALEAEIKGRYGWPDVHPALQRKFDRDMSTVDGARKALAPLLEEKP